VSALETEVSDPNDLTFRIKMTITYNPLKPKFYLDHSRSHKTRHSWLWEPSAIVMVLCLSTVQVLSTLKTSGCWEPML